MNFVQGGARVATDGLFDDEKGLGLYRGYPNPVENFLYVDGVEDGAPVGVLDMSGKQVLKTEVQNSSVNVATLYSGFYIVQIRSRERLIRMKVRKK
jgi:hypothetical protein